MNNNQTIKFFIFGGWLLIILNIFNPMTFASLAEYEDNVTIPTTIQAVDAEDHFEDASDKLIFESPFKRKSSDTVRVLSIDGGGARGLIVAHWLAALEKKTGKYISEMFDVITGTSTGGIIAAALTIPDEKDPTKPKYSASRIIDVYKELGDKIFKRSIWQKITNPGGLRKAKYSASGLEKGLVDYFGDVELKSTLNQVIMPAYDLEHRSMYTFETGKAREDAEDNYLLRDSVRATTAAPTYFKPAFIESTTGEKKHLVDGGVVANNPVMLGSTNAQNLFNVPREDLLVVSIGTGLKRQTISGDDAKGWSKLGWVPSLVETMTSDVAMEHLVKESFPEIEGERRYFRFQTPLINANPEMDNVSKKNIRKLEIDAETAIDSQDYALSALSKQLLKGI